jgi:hypothetical protein
MLQSGLFEAGRNGAWMRVVLPFYSPRVDVTMWTSILLGVEFGLLLLGLATTMVLFVGSCF